MKRKVIVFLVLWFCFSVSCFGITPEEIFSYEDISLKEIDFYTGESFHVIEDYRSFKNVKDILKYSYFYEKEKLKTEDYVSNNEKGFPLCTQHVSYESESNDNYLYDEKGRLIQISSGWTYKYIDDNSREIYYKGKLQNKEHVTIKDNSITIDSGIGTIHKEIFVYEKNKIRNYTCISFYKTGQILHDIEIEYDNKDRISSVLESYGPEDKRNKRLVFYNEKDQIYRVELYINNNLTLNSVFLFSNFDSNGNFCISKKYNKDDSLIYTVTRNIEYR